MSVRNDSREFIFMGMNTLLELAQKRYSCRIFIEKTVEAEKITAGFGSRPHCADSDQRSACPSLRSQVRVRPLEDPQSNPNGLQCSGRPHGLLRLVDQLQSKQVQRSARQRLRRWQHRDDTHDARSQRPGT